MTVAELIAELSKVDQAAKVVTHDGDSVGEVIEVVQVASVVYVDHEPYI